MAARYSKPGYSRGHRSRPGGRPRYKPCVRFKLLGSCQYGGSCRFSHDRSLPPDQRHEGYIQLPDRLPMSVAVGRSAMNLRSIYEETECVIVPSAKSSREVTVITSSARGLATVTDRLKALFARLYPLGPTWCFLHTEGLKSVEGITFQEYRGHLPQKYKQRGYKLYTTCGVQTAAAATASTDDVDALLSGLQELSLQSGADPKETFHKAMASVSMAPTKERVRVMESHQDAMKEQLKDALEWYLSDKDPEIRKEVPKLEARLGKVLWSDLPQDACTGDTWEAQQFAQFVMEDSSHNRIFVTSVVEKDVQALRQELQEGGIGECKSTLETLDIKLSSLGDREQLDLRIKLKDGKTELLVVKMSERKVLTFDALCLHRHHDIRLSLNLFKVAKERTPPFRVAQQMLQTLRFSMPGKFDFVALTRQWSVTFIRNKKRTSYVIDGKYITSISEVREHTVKGSSQNDTYTVNLQDCEQHYEIEFHNMAWECTFGKDVNPTPEDCLKLFMDEPAVDPQVLPPRPVGQPWLPDEILADVDDLLENAESANELLG